ncbi:hypothetical protein [Lactobacillus intestinalis]|uniref:hypothetical protein n=1 Tax=Lactobacillus intestinalis TaxID=151781 RepID=UPI00260386D5|nr:hypothetical protein [Lactobacillus intestinalis]
MEEKINRALLRAGYNTHMEFNQMISEIEQSQKQWAEIIEKHIDKILQLTKEYHELALKITMQAKTDGVPEDIMNSNNQSLEVMDAFNQEILDFDNFLNDLSQRQHLIDLIKTVNYTNNLLYKLKTK